MTIYAFFRTFPLLAACLLVVPAALAVQTDCDDPEAEDGWRALLSKYPTDNELRALYQLRRTLCRQVEADRIPLDEASERFEAARQRLIGKWHQKNERRSSVTGDAG